ncbi:MAG: GNAT family N-acetyltransferase [Planctomycetota bacterium]|nr:GNAT family N-acetyltransferase [Planctomycetota bacterium]
MTAGLNPSSTRLRGATPGDIPAIMEIENASFLHAGERFGERRVNYLIRSARAIVTVAEAGETQDAGPNVLGWVVGFTWTRTSQPWGRIYALAIHPGARGRRLGPLLLEHMIQTLRQQGSKRIFLEVRPDNEVAVRLYEKLGFFLCRVLPDYYGAGQPAQRMERAV